MGYAKHVGRVGALAVALGVGVGLGAAPGTAFADESDQQVSSAEVNAPASIVTADEPATSTVPTTPHDGSDAKDPDVGTAPDPRDGIVQAGGGAIVRSSLGSESESAPKPESVPEPEIVTPPTPVDSPAPSVEVKSTPPGQPEPPVENDPPPQPVEPAVARVARNTDLDVVTPPAVDPAPAAPFSAYARIPLTANPIATARVAAPVTTPPPALVAPAPAPAPSLRQLILAPLTSLVNGILGAFGLGPVALPAGSPLTPFPLLELTFAIFRRIESTLSNQTPAATYTIGTPSATGTFTGQIVGTDPDGDLLTYTVTGAATHGTVDLRPDGSFAYTTTDPTWAQTGRPDEFTVTIGDATNFHLHAPGTTHTTLVTVRVDGPPAAPDLGQVRGALNVPNPTNAPLTYQVTSAPPQGGTVAVDAAGNYVYTPTYAARHQAASLTAAPEDKTYTFGVRATGQGVDATVTVEVTISPANEQPQALESPTRTTDPNDGTVSGYVTATDGDADPLDVTTDYDTTQGTLTYEPTTGLYSFTPTPEARHAAAATTPVASFAAFRSLSALAAPDPAIAVLTFTFTDGYGGVTTRVVSVPISPLNEDPDVASNIGTVDPITRIVSGTFVVTDGDGDPISFSANGVDHGDVTFVDGTWTYTPTAAALHDAARVDASTAQTTDAFTLSIDDGHGGVVDVPVSVSLLSPIAGATAQVRVVPAGNGAFYVTVGADGRYVYVSDTKSATIGVLDTTTGNVTYIETTSTVGASRLTPDGTRLYVVGGGNGTVTVIDTTTNTLVTTIPVGGYANDLAVNAAGTRVYVAVNTPNEQFDLVVINVADNTVTRTYLGPAAEFPTLSPDGTKLYFKDYRTDGVRVIDTDTLAITDVLTDSDFGYFALAPDGRHLYVAGYTGLRVYDAETGELVRSLSGVGNGQILLLSPDGSKVFTTGSEIYDAPATLSIVDTTTYAITTVTAGPDPVNAVVTPDGRKVLTLNRDGTVSVIDTVTLTSESIATGAAFNEFYQVAISPDGRQVYLPLYDANSLAIISASTVNTAPTLTVTQVADPGSGGVVYTATAFDADGDDIAYTTTPLVRGTLTDLGAGQYRFVPDLAQIGHLPTGVNDVIAFTASDGHGGAVTVRGTYDVAASDELQMVRTVDFDGQVRSVVVSVDGSRAYVSVSDGSQHPRTVVVDTATGAVLDTLPFSGASQDALSLSANGTRLLINQGTLVVVGTDDLHDTIFSTNANADYAELSADGRKVYAVGGGQVSVYDVDPASGTFGTIVATIESDGYPTWMARGADGIIYVATSDFRITAIDPTTDTVIASVRASSGFYSVTGSPGRAYATTYGGTLAVIDTDTNTLLDEVRLRTESNGPYATVTVDGSRLYLSRFGEGLFSVYDPDTQTILATVRVAAEDDRANRVNAAAVSADGSVVVVPFGRSIALIGTGRTIGL